MRLKADQEVSSFCCAGLSQIGAFLLGRMKTSWEMALVLSSTLYLCVAVSLPFLLSKYGEIHSLVFSSKYWTDDGQTTVHPFREIMMENNRHGCQG